MTPERYSLTLEIDPAQPEFSGEVEIALRTNQATQHIRRASGTMSGGFSLNAAVRIEATDRKGLESQGQG